MKKFALIALFALCVAPVFAQVTPLSDSDSGSVTLSILPFSLVNVDDLGFGTVSPTATQFSNTLAWEASANFPFSLAITNPGALTGSNGGSISYTTAGAPTAGSYLAGEHKGTMTITVRDITLADLYGDYSATITITITEESL